MKNKIALLIVLALVLSLVLAFTSCGGSTETDTDNESQKADTDTQTVDETGTNEKNDNEDADTEATETDTDTETETDTEADDLNTDTTDTSTDTQKPESNEGESNKHKELYSQIKGGKFLENLGDSTIEKEDATAVNFSPYRLICTYDELLEFAENASNIDSSVFEENIILYVKQRYPNICGEPVGYSDFKIENGELFITYSKYKYRLENSGELITYYKDYIVIPKSELPLELERNGTIGVIINVIELNHMEGINKVEEQTVPLNSAWILRTKDEVNEFASTYNITDKAFPYSDEVVVAIYMKRPQKIMYVDEIQNTHQGYLAEVNGSNLKITYLYDENNAGETEYYIDFIVLPKEMLEGVEEIEVALEPRQNPVLNIGTAY
ncbi:MAG: hypothetical protein E7602_05695 [Ruminococcaceae bacterium]|nr:hypothetical protein [Oscillospiraceae bacterium]